MGKEQSSGSTNPISPHLPFPSKISWSNVFYGDSISEVWDAKAIDSQFSRPPEPSCSLIRSVRLDIVVQRIANPATCIGQEVILFSKVLRMSLIHLVWSHIEEMIDTGDLSSEEYENMSARFTLGSNFNSIHNVSSCQPFVDQAWLDIPIHPIKLRRCDASVLKRADLLPLNMFSVTYTDGSFRVLPSQYEALKLFDEHNAPLNSAQSTEDVYGRFGDVAFRALKNNHRSPGGHDKTPAIRSKLPLRDGLRALQDKKLRIKRKLKEVRAELSAEDIDMDQYMGSKQETGDGNVSHGESSPQRREAPCRHVNTSLALQQRIHQMRMASELLDIFPITVASKATSLSTIRGLPMPDLKDEESLTSVKEEDLSAALGCAAHLVQMISKIAFVQLRYRPYCHVSRSGMQDDGANLFPLFLHGQGPNEHRVLVKALQLLQADVDYLAERLQLTEIKADAHLLEKIRQLLLSLASHG